MCCYCIIPGLKVRHVVRIVRVHVVASKYFWLCIQIFFSGCTWCRRRVRMRWSGPWPWWSSSASSCARQSPARRRSRGLGENKFSKSSDIHLTHRHGDQTSDYWINCDVVMWLMLEQGCCACYLECCWRNGQMKPQKICESSRDSLVSSANNKDTAI